MSHEHSHDCGCGEEELQGNLITLTDEDGTEYELEHIDTLEMNDEVYLALIPAEITVEDEAELVILKVATLEDGEEMLISLDDDVEAMNVYNAFMDRLDEMYERGEDE